MRNKKENDDVRNCAFGADIVVLCDRIYAGLLKLFKYKKAESRFLSFPRDAGDGT